MSYINYYRFTLSWGATSQVVSPLYDGSTSFVYDPEPNQVFKRKKLNGKLTFSREVFDLVMAESLETEFTLLVEETTAATSPVYTENWRGVFTRAETTPDEDNKYFEVTPRPVDAYTAVLDAMDREFNIVDLPIARTQVNYKKQAVLQIYIVGQSIITNVTGGYFWEQPVSIPTTNEDDLLNFHHFAKRDTIIKVDGFGTTDLSGFYTLTAGNAHDTTAEFSNGTYTIRHGGGVDIWSISNASNTVLGSHLGSTPFEENFVMSTEVGQWRLSMSETYVRLLTDVETVTGLTLHQFQSNDLTDDTFSFKYVSAITNGYFLFGGYSTNVNNNGLLNSDLPTNNIDQYYTKPSASASLRPISRNEWGVISVWFEIDTTLKGLILDASNDRYVTESFEIGQVIKSMLSEIDSTIIFDSTVLHSQFLYSATNPVNASAETGKIFITPKSNVLVDQYDTPATKGILKLGEVANMLLATHGLKWYIDSSNNFILEHISFFENGLSYTAPNIAFSIVSEGSLQTGKKWSYGTNKFTYDRPSMPEEIRFSWMDEVSPHFKGYDIQINSNYVNKGNYQDYNIAKFTSDIDLMQTHSTSFNKTGFALLSAVFDSVTFKYNVPLVEITAEGSTYQVQNGYLAFVYLHEFFHRHGLPAEDITINKQATTAESITRRKIQELEVTVTAEPNPLELINTDQGEAEITRLETYLFHDGTTRKRVKVILKLPTT